jgi:hypothetical protein
MIRTKQPQVLDAMNRITSIVYMDVSGPDAREQGIVKFNVNFHVIDIEYKTEIEMRPNGDLNELGEQILASTLVTYAKPFFKTVHSREVKYRDAVYYDVVGNPKPNQFDALMITQIEYVNSRVWTGNELQQLYFWELTANDLEIVTQEQLDLLLTPYEV